MEVPAGEGADGPGVGEGQYRQTRKSHGFVPVSQAHLPQLPRAEGGTISGLWPPDQAEITTQWTARLSSGARAARPLLLPLHTPRGGPDHLSSFPNLGQRGAHPLGLPESSTVSLN